jgi:hypothetical protein
MATPRYYREQARLLFLWAQACPNPKIAERMNARADEYLIMAESIEEIGSAPSSMNRPSLNERNVQ